MRTPIKKKLWRDLSSKQIKEIIDGAGERVITEHYFSRHFPFYHRYKEILVFGGHCGLCGKWNWSWCQKGFEWTGPCEDCLKEVKDGTEDIGK